MKSLKISAITKLLTLKLIFLDYEG